MRSAPCVLALLSVRALQALNNKNVDASDVSVGNQKSSFLFSYPTTDRKMLVLLLCLNLMPSKH